LPPKLVSVTLLLSGTVIFLGLGSHSSVLALVEEVAIEAFQELKTQAHLGHIGINGIVCGGRSHFFQRLRGVSQPSCPAHGKCSRQIA